MPDNTISPEALAARARRAAEIARRERVVERCGPASSNRTFLVDKETGKPCPTRGNLMCTNEDPNHLHIFSHMLAEADRCGPAGPKRPDPNGDDTAEYEPIRWESAEELE